MRIEIESTARRHNITDIEIRTVVSYPELRCSLKPRMVEVDTALVLFCAPAAPNQPWIEVIADLIDPAVAIVFHAMMLRAALVKSLGLASLIEPEYGRQRA